MSLERTLKVAVGRLRAVKSDSEAQVKQSIILPILAALDWDYSDPEVCKTEYRTDDGLVDYALLAFGKPLVFIEAKRVGALNATGEAQLFSYASNRGVPLLVLTDGNRWDFYLSMAPGIPADRLFFRLELSIERKLAENASFFEEHLRRDRVVSGEAKRSADERHEELLRRRRAREAIEPAWNALLAEPDEALCELVSTRVENECGIKPEINAVAEFLVGFSPEPSPFESFSAEIPGRQKRRPNRRQIVGFEYGGAKFLAGSATVTLCQILSVFELQNPLFLDRFALRVATKSRNLVAKDRADLYDKSHLVQKYSRKLAGDWWIGTNLNTVQVRRHIETACDVAGIEFGSQLKLIERKRPAIGNTGT